MKLKTVQGHLEAFDIAACSEVQHLGIRKGLHMGFLTGFGVGVVMAKEAFIKCQLENGELFDSGKFVAALNNYAQQVLKAQADIK